MAKNNNSVGLHFEADIVDLKTGLKEIKTELNQANKDFAQATAGMDKWASSSDGLNAKLAQLNTKLSGQKKTVELYQAEIERVSKLEGEHGAELDILRGKLQDAEIAVAKTEKEVRKYSTSLEDVQKQEKEANSSLSKLTSTIEEQEAELKGLKDEYKDAVITYGKNSKEAKALKKEIEDLSGELDDNKKQVQFADKQLELLEDQFDDTADAADDFSKGIDGIKDIGSTVAKGVGALAAGIGAIGGAFLATAEGTREFRTNMAKLETGFTEAGLSAEDASNTFKEMYSILGDDGQATEATAFLAKFADNEKELASATHTLTGIYATFGASLPLEGLTEAINHTSSLGSVQGNLADALEWSGINVDDFNAQLAECSDEEERQALIMETLSGVYDGAADKYKEVNADVIESNKAQANLSETMAQFGEKAEPILTAVKDGFNTVLQEILKLTKDVDFNAIAESIKGGFAYFIDTIVPAIKDGFQWILDNKDILIAGIVAIGTAMLAWNVVSIIQGVVTAIKGLTVVMKANPIGIVVTLIAGLVAAFITLWNTSDEFRQFWINLWDKIKTACSNAWDGIKKVWGVVADWFGDVFNGIVNWFKGIPEKISGFFSNAWKKVKEAWANVTDFFSGIKDKVINAFTDLPKKMLDVGKNLVEGLWNGIKNMTSWVTDKLKGFGDSILGGIKNFFGIHSPSKKMAEIGKFLDEGLAQGIEKNKGIVTKATDDMSEEVTDSVSKIKEEIESLNNLKIKNGENPFKGWTHAALNAENIELQNQLKSIENDILVNAKAQEKLGESAELVTEKAGLVAEKYKAQSTQMDIFNQKLEYYKKYNEEVPQWVQEAYDTLKTELAETEKEIEDVSKALDECLKKDGCSSTKSLQKTFEGFIDKSESKLEKWKKGWGKVCEYMANQFQHAGNAVMSIVDAIGDYQEQQHENEMNRIDQELKEYNKAKDSELEKYRTSADEELIKLQEKLNAGLISETEFNTGKQAIQQSLADNEKRIEDEKAAREQEALVKKDEIARKQFEANKATSIANALVQGALAIVTGFAQLGPIGGAINAGVQAALTAAQVATIASQQYVPMLAKGGIVDSPTLAMIGEAGKEAVMPLENNTGWISDLAQKISSILEKDLSLGIGQPQLAYAGQPVVNNYNNYNQTINSPKQLTRREIYRDTKNLLALRGR